MMQEQIQADAALNPSTFGEVLIMLLKILMSTRKSVTSNVIRPGIASGLMRKLTYE